MLDNLDIRINWLLTLWINFTKLPFYQAKKLPILIYGWKSDIHINKLVLDIPTDKINFAMIKIGCMFDVCTWAHYGSIIHTKGSIVVKGSCVIGRGFSYWGSRQSELIIGPNTIINGNCSYHCKKRITVGRNFHCGWSSYVSDTDFHPCRDMHTGNIISETSEVNIGDNVWVGHHCKIVKNSEIPDWTIVSQSSLINKKYTCEPYHLLAGSPAKEIQGRLIRREDLYIRGLRDSSFNITKGFRIFNLD